MDSDEDLPRTKRARESDAFDPTDLGSDVDDGYGSDLYGDEEDRARLAAMTELEREEILALRAEARDEEKQRRRTARLAAGVGAKPAKRGAAAAAPDRAAARSKQPAAEARRQAAADLRAARRVGAARAADREARRSASAEPAGGEAGDYTTRRKAAADGLDEGYETGEDARPSTAAAVARARRYGDEDEDGEEGDDEPATHAEAVAAQVRRAQLARWLGEPHAGKTLPGTLIRLAFNRAYMAAEVVEVVTRPPGTYRDAGRPVPSPYTVVAGEVPRPARAPGAAGPPPAVAGVAAPTKSLQTSSWLSIRRGASTRLFPAHLVSNAPLTEEEFESWQRQLARDGLRPWPRRAARAAAAAIAEGAAYTYTAADVAALVDARRAAGGARNRAVERARLASLHAAAVEAGKDAGEVADLAGKLAALDAAAAAERSARAAAAARSMDEVNRRNAERNLAISLKGAAGGGGGGGDGEGGDGGGEAADPFKRRETRPRHMWATGRTKAATTGEGGEDAPSQPAAPVAPPPADAGPRADEVDPAHLYAPVLALDLGKLSTAGGGPAAVPTTAADLARKLLGAAWAPPARDGAAGGETITLAEYFARRQGVGPQ